MRFPLALASLVLFSGFGSCTTDFSAMCSAELPRFEQEFGDAVAALSSSKDGRHLASSGAESARAELARWQRWAEDKLKTTQSYIDLTDADPRYSAIRKELNQVANFLVSFHGYSELGRSDRMAWSLAQVREHAWRARELACNVR